MSTGAAANQAGWIDPPQKVRRSFDIEVKVCPPSNVETTHRYSALFTSSFDAYDDALARFPWATRIVAKPRAQAGGAL